MQMYSVNQTQVSVLMSPSTYNTTQIQMCLFVSLQYELPVTNSKDTVQNISVFL